MKLKNRLQWYVQESVDLRKVEASQKLQKIKMQRKDDVVNGLVISATSLLECYL